jgi:tRNA pseudouridine38-40 synthase
MATIIVVGSTSLESQAFRSATPSLSSVTPYSSTWRRQHHRPLYSSVDKHSNNNRISQKDDLLFTDEDKIDRRDADEVLEVDAAFDFHKSFVRYRCRVSYHGAGFNGFQFQPNIRSVQGELETMLSRRFNQPVRVSGAGRTDAGVHARGQAIHFDLKKKHAPKSSSNDDNEDDNDPQEENLSQIQYSLNKMFPQGDLRIWNLSRAPPACLEFVNGKEGMYHWNVMRKTHAKLYSYRFSTSPAMDPTERHTRWQLDLITPRTGQRAVLNTTHLQTLLKCYEGTHDFRCFAGAVEQEQKKYLAAKRKRGGSEEGANDDAPATPQDLVPTSEMDTVRTVYSVTLVDEANDNYRIDFMLEGALYKMVRNMVGTAMDVCLGKNNLNEQYFMSLLQPRDNKNSNLEAGKTLTRNNNLSKPAPPQGLTLEWVYYDGDPYF